MQPATTDLRFPIGKHKRTENLTPARREELIGIIAGTPQKLREALRGLSAEQLDTPYRPDGWTVRQVVHHVPDSHLNAYMRFKLALTEERPTIKPYEEDRWAELADTFSTPIEVSLTLLESLHVRWVNLLRSLPEADWQRTLLHPQNGEMTLLNVLDLYAWHGPHHVAHVTTLRERMGW
ncbi:MAG: putative metal-dependent hydrolase [Cytophagales bacterium]|nr:putative metal-dependent hydrolase [Cytophagales bacterium]